MSNSNTIFSRSRKRIDSFFIHLTNIIIIVYYYYTVLCIMQYNQEVTGDTMTLVNNYQLSGYTK